MLRTVIALSIAVTICCTIARSGVANELFEHAKAQAAADMRVCESKFPGGVRATAVARAKCQIEALGNMRIVTSPAALPLLERFFKVRLYVAEQIAMGKMTFEQANRIIVETRNEVIAADQRIFQRQKQTTGALRPQAPVIQRPVIVDPGPVVCIHISPMVTTCD